MKQEPNNQQAESEANRFAEDLLYSMEGIESAQPQPYMYTRALARMERSKGQDSSSISWLLSSKLSLGVLATLVIINVTALWYYVDNQGISFGQNATAEKIIEDYQLDYRSTYAYLEE